MGRSIAKLLASSVAAVCVLSLASFAGIAQEVSGERQSEDRVEIPSPPLPPFYARRDRVLARTGPGLKFAGPDRLSIGRPYKVVGKVSSFEDSGIQHWYKVDFGGRFGFVSDIDVISEPIYLQLQQGAKFADDIEALWEGWKAKSSGKYAEHTGVYSLTKRCDDLEGRIQILDAARTGLGKWLIWFENDTMFLLPMTGTLTPQQGKLIPSRVFKGAKESTQWFRWNKDEVAFVNGSYAFAPTVTANGVSYQWAERCKGTDEERVLLGMIGLHEREFERVASE